MKNYMPPFFILTLFMLTSFSAPDDQSVVTENYPEEEVFSCFLTQTNPNDGNCPASYNFIAPLGCDSYSWSLSGDAYFAGGTTSNSVTVTVQRQQSVGGSFTITLVKTGSCFGPGSCRQSFGVTAEIYCE